MPTITSYVGNNMEQILNLQDKNDEIFLFNLVNTNKEELEHIFSNKKDETSTKIEYIDFLKK
jgi:predicted nucleic acid-binding Zn finger protein